MLSKKIKNKKEIISVARTLKKQGKKIVVFSGSFDILHLGHLDAIKAAKKQGDILIILLNSDKSIKMYKGAGHPLNSQQKRMQAISALDAVDYVALFDELTPESMLAEIKPDIYCNGSDWGKNCIERRVVEEHGGKVYVLPWKKGFSTTALVKKMAKGRMQPEIKAVFLDRDGTINADRENYVKEVDEFIFLPGAVEAIKRLSETEYKIIVITNQSGIGKKIITKNKLQEIHRWMVAQLKKHGARIDGIYYCSHHPDAGCGCRKPQPGMFLKAAKDFRINLSKSWMVGDNPKDVIAARRANVRGIKIGAKLPKELKLEANHYVKSLLKAVEIIIKKES